MVSADLVPVMLGDKWGEVVPLLSGMAVYGILRGLMLTAWPAMYAVGRVREVALIVWLQGILTVACAVAAGLAAYDVEEAELTADVIELVERLAAEGLITVER